MISFFLGYAAPGKSYFGAPPLFANPTPILIGFFLIVYQLITIIIGYTFWRSFCAPVKIRILWNLKSFQLIKNKELFNRQIETLIILSLSFPFGYLICVAINRIVSIVLIQNYALIVLIFVYTTLMTVLTGIRIYGRNFNIGTVKPFFVFSFFLIISLIIFLQTLTGHITGDSIAGLIQGIIDNNFLDSHKKFPIITKQYDEILYLYPFLKYITQPNSNYLLFWWGLNAFSKMFAAAAIFLFCNHFALKFSTTMFILFLTLFGCHFFYPFGGYRLLFDAGNPLGYSLHIGRVISAILPFLVFLFLKDFKITKKKTLLHITALFLLGLGLSSLTINVFLVPLVGIILWISLSIFPKRINILKTSSLIFAFIFLLYPFIIYNRSNFFTISAFLLFSFILFLSVTFIPLISDIKLCFQSGNRLFILIPLGAGTIIGSLFLGNVFILKLQHLINMLFPDITIYSQIKLTTKVDLFKASIYCGQVALVHCTGIGPFLRSFGFINIMISLAFFYLSKLFKKNRAGLHLGPILASILYTGSFFFLLGMFFYDFVNVDGDLGWVQVWFKSRMIETSYYFILASSIIIIEASSIKVYKALVISSTTIWISFQFIYFNHFDHITSFFKNLTYIYKHLLFGIP